MAPVRSLLGGRFRTAMRGALALLCLVPQGGLALAAAPPAYGPQGLPRQQRALTACTPTGSFTNCTRVTYSGGDQTFTVPAGVTAVYARVFGAGGAGSPRAYYTGQYGGGGGGYTTGTLAVTPGQVLTLTAGQGGRLNSTTSTYGGGGAGGQGYTAANGSSATGGSGGGMSAVWNGASGTNPLVVAGGGGGSSPGGDATTPAAGGGGGSNGGQDNQPAASGRGGTQTAGGAAATQTACAAATAGAQYQGGRGGASPQNEGGGGGGGGYYGGGGGACQRGGTLDANGMGGGGSGYNRGTGVTNTQTSNGTNSSGNGVGGTSGGRSDAQYTSGSGIGDGGGYTDGGNGEIVLEWVTQVGLSVKKTASPTTYVPGQRLTYTFVVSNAGPAPAVNAPVRDALPSALSGFTWTCASGGTGSSCGAASGTGSLDTTATIAANSSVTYTVTGIVPSATTGTLSNTATVTRPAASTDPNCGPTCSSTVDTPGRATTGLSVTKTPDKNPYVPGQPLTYTIVVKNDGPSDAIGTSVKDTLPTTIRNFSWTCTAAGGASCGSPASGTGDINTTVDLPAGSQVTYRLTGTVPADATGSLDNRATVTPPGGTTDPNCSPSCTSTANPVPPGNQANLVVSKTVLTSPVVPGQQIKWQVKVTNNGPSRARNVVVTDQVPAGVTAASMANDQDGAACPITGGTATCPAVEIPVNGTASWTLTGTLDPNATATPTNTALVTGGPDPSASTRTAVASPTASPSPQANLTISKTLLTNPVVPGAQIQWRVTVTDNGPSRARNVVVTDQVPAGVTGATMRQGADGADCPISGGTATCPAVEIAAGSSQTWTLTGTLDPNATVTPTNTAVVTGGPDPGATARTAVASPTASPSPQANLTVSKSLLTSPVVPGQPVQWRVTVTNNGPSRARNVVVTDQVPSGVSGATMTADTGGANCPISGGVATCPAVEIPAGSSLSWTLAGTLDANATTTPTNTVTVTGGPDPAASTHTAVASPSGSPSPQANLKVSKSLVTNPVVPGQRIEWRVNVLNSGPSRARNVVVTDTVPAGVTNPVMTAPDGTTCPISGGVATCPGVEIPAGQALNWTLTGTLDPNATATPTNTVTVTGGPDPTASTHTAVASPSGSPSPQANLTVSKVLLTNPVVPGQQIQWRVTVTNNGPSRARNVVVTDQVPSGVSGATMTADTGGANCPISGGVATCPAVEIPAGSSLSWTLAGTLDANATTTPTNTVTVTGGPDPAASTHTAVASPSGSPSPQANLKVSKSLVTNPVVPGQRIEWRVNVLNSGPSRARNVVVTDTVPAGVTNPVMTAPDGTTCPISGGVATCPGVEIPAGQALNWTLTGTLDPNATATPTNTVTVTGGPDPTASTHTAVASPSGSPSPQANLTVSKVLLTNPVVPGQQIQWRVTVTNNGPSRARNVVVTDQVPSGVSGATMTADTGGANCPISGGVATCPAVEIPAGSSLSWTLAGTLDANATTTPTNTATVTGGPDPATPTHTAVASPSDSPSPQANLTVSKVLLTNPVVPGRQIQWRVTVTNNGPSRARNVVVTDTVPAGVTNPVMTASDGTGCPISGGVATCPAVEIPAGSSQTWTLTGTLASDATSTPVNSVTVTGGPDPAASTRTAVASPTNSPSPQANLTVSKVLLTNPVVPGQQIQWRVTVTNNGPSRARDVIVRDQVPTGVTGATMTADTGGANCPISSGIATCPAVEIPAGSSQTWTLSGTLDANATTTPANTVTVTGGPDPATPTHTAVASPSDSPSPQANLTASKVLLTNPVVPGQQIQWRVSVTNNGPSRARNVVVTDQVPTGVNNPAMASADGTPCPISSGTATCPAVEIPAGQTLTWTLTGTLDANATATPANTATVTGGPDPATPTHTAVATPTNTPSTQANLTASKVLLTNPVVPGQQIQWRVSVTNNGPSRARDVVVTDTVPAGVTGASMKADADNTPCPINGGTATCPAVEIPVGQTLTWTLTGTLAQDATVTPANTATVTGGPDPATPTHTAIASPTNSPTSQANLTVSKVLLTNPIVPGQQIQWQVSVTNNGPSRARDVVVTDQVPAGVGNASMKADVGGANCPIANTLATCPAVEIPVGQTLTWTLTGTLDANATATPANTATVTGGPDPATPTHTAVASPTNTPSTQANLTASKILLTNPVVPGQQIQWRVSVTNNGPSRARDVVVTDTVPAGVTGASMKADTDNTPCPISGGTATCPAVEIPAGSSMTWTLTGTLDANATTTPTNTATVTGGPDPATPTHTAVASPTNTPSTQANLTVSKVLLTNPVVPGQQIQWQVNVTNNGPSRARDVVVTDTVPAGVNNPAMTATDGTNCPINNGTATCPAVEIPAGQTLTWTLTGTLDANATVTPTNTTTVTGGPDPATPTHTAVASPTTTPSTQANLTTSKVLLTNPVVPGQQIQWQVNVTNNGPSRARDVVVTDTVPAGVNNPAMTAADGTNCPISSGTATCPAVEIPVGQTLTWTLTGMLAQDATVTPTNTATVTGGPDPATPTHTAVASPTNSPSAQANLTVSKTLLTNPVVPGQQIQWQVSVTNNGPSRARDVIVTDQVPVGVTGASLKADADNTPCPINAGTATCPAVEIPVGQTLTWTLTGTLDANATVTPTNTATVTGGPDPATPTHTAIATPTNRPSTQANLTVSKTLLTNPVVPGQQIQWQVTVTNNGPSRARDVVVTDQVPTGVNNAAMASADGTNCPINNGTATCPTVEIPAGQTLTWTLTGTLDANATVTPTNTTTVTGGPDPATPTHTAIASPSNSPSAQANLTVSKVLLTNPVVPGQQIQWQVSVTNNGPSRARDVVVTDTVPPGVNNPAMTAAGGTNCPISGGVATCPAVEIPVGQTLTWTLTGTLAQDSTVTPTNTATVTGGPDPATPTHTAVASPTNTPTPHANLTASKVLLTNPVVPGQQIQWQVSVTNNGPSRARDVVVTDTVPPGVNNPAMTAAGGTNCPISGGVATCPAVEIPVGQTLTWTLTGTLAQDSTVTPTNTATVTGGPDPATPTHTAVASPTNTPTPHANLTASKVLLTNPVVPGQQIQWQVSVTNNGPSRARDVVVTDTVPPGVNNPAMTAAGGTNCPINGRTAACPAVEIPVGQTLTWTLTGTLAQDATVTPTNTATVTGGPDPATPTHTAVASPTNTPAPQANLTVSKVLLTNPVVPGQQIQWRVTVTNNGPSRARNVVVTDRVPDGVGGPSMTAGDGSVCAIADGTAVCPAVELEVGQTVSYTLSGTLMQDATVTPTNTAVVTGGPDPATPTHTAVASPTGSPEPQASLTVAKSLLTDPVVPGEVVQWRVTVTNNGPSKARNVVITDRIPNGVSDAVLQSDADASACPISNGLATCPAIELEVGQTASYTLTATLAPDATVTPTNTVTVTGGPDPATPTHTAVASPTNTPTPQANLSIAKSLVTNPVVPGQQIQWRVTVTNHGPSRARNVVVTDTVPAQVNGAVMTSDADGTNCPITGGTATCPAVEIPADGSVSYTVTGTLDPAATSTPINVAVVTGGPDPTATAHTATAHASETVEPRASLTVSKALLTDPVVPGEAIAWRISVTNNGPSVARDVVVSDRIPEGVVGASLSPDATRAACPVTGGTAVCPPVEIPVGGTVTYTLSGTLAQDATVTPVNTVVVTGGPDPATPTHTAVASPTASPEPQAKLTVSKVLVTDPVVPGRTVQWRVTVVNNGPSRARNVVVTDRVPDGVSGASMASDENGTACPVASGTATCPAIDLEVGETASYTLSGTLAQDATVTPTNTVVVTGGPDPATPTHTAVASPTASPEPQANLVVAKVLVTDPVVPGQQIQWRVTVTNHGPSRARNVVVTDRVPAGVSNASMAAQDGTACAIANGTATCPAVELASGETLAWTLTGTLDPDAAVTPTNTVVVTGGPDPATPTHTAVASPTAGPEPQANLVVAKVLVTDPVVPGQQIQWRVTVTNNGPSRARNVVVTDPVPAGVDGASMAADNGTACPITNGTATCPAVEIAAGETRTWTLTGTLHAGATVTPTNTVTVTGGPDPATPTHTVVASPSGTPVQEARLSVSKALLTDPVVPGQRIQWQVSVTNRGPSVARDVVVADRVPAGVNDASMAADDGTACPIAGGTATCPAVGIPVGATRTWTLTGTLDAGATVTPTNAVTVTGGPDPATPTHTAVASPSVEPVLQAHLTVAKSLVTNPVVPGAPVEWRVTVTNDGPSLARGVVVTDRIPAGVLDASVTAQDGTVCPIADGTATCPAVEIPVGRTLAWTVKGTLDPGATVTPTNTATVTGGPDPATPTHTAVASPSESPSAQARLSVAKVLLTDPVVAGQRIQWRVTVTNHGPSRARNVVVTDRVPAGVNGASMTADDGTACPITDGTATCPAVEIPVGGTAGWTLTGTLNADATAVPLNTVVVTGGPDPDATDHTTVATPTVPITVRHDLLLTKHATPADPKAGDRVTYTVTATNRASGTYFGAVVTDDLSGVLDGAVYGLDARADTGRTAYAAPRLTWTLDLRPGATATLSYTVTVKPGAGGATLVNRLSADGSNCTGSANGNGSVNGGGVGARRAAAVSPSGNCSTTTTVRKLPSPSPSPTTRPPLPPTGSGSPKPALLLTVLFLALGGLLVAARRSRR
ncbi:DUF11 domain-containing protein [Kitasatospora purpeofusca]|uniref:DUF7927 domain-containing protein n=1 Tax=Kitasatospora purpeofusca TaxID=67352 RepID=UPI0022554310|nr:hypothetical protein [Kitasatospora purpeofusca]MCX4690423.1 DUF11 domain-containing protein [Kitasatospora purpeofusca]